MKKPDIDNVEVDMVPLIDIISLLLMFLIIVGDTTASTNSVKMRLPVADQAKTEKEWGKEVKTEGRIVIQIKPPDEGDKNGKYYAVFNNAKHSTAEDAGKSLKDHLQRYIDDEMGHGRAHLVEPEKQALDIPVKLRIPEDCPMVEAEIVLFTLAQCKLVDIQYAASGKKR